MTPNIAEESITYILYIVTIIQGEPEKRIPKRHVGMGTFCGSKITAGYF